MVSRVTWLHISDVHIASEYSYDRDVVLRSLVKSAPNFLSRGLKPDLIFFTGDVAIAGKEAEYEPASRFFDDLISAFGIEKSNLYVVPGNHDVDRTRGLSLTRTLSSQEQSNAYFSSNESATHIAIRQERFAQWFNQYFKEIRTFPTQTTCGPYEEVTLNGVKLGIVPVNTAAFSVGDDDQGKLWVGRKCVDELFEGVAERPDLTVGLMHHPLDWLHEIERTQVTSLIRDRCDVILRGHLHQTEAEQIAGSSGASLHLAAGAGYQGSKWPNRAMFAEFVGGEVKVVPIRYNDAPSPSWTIDTAIFPSGVDYSHTFVIGENVKVALGDDARVAESNLPATIPILEHPKDIDVGQATPSAARQSFEQDLFVGPSGKFLYAEPRLSRVSPSAGAVTDAPVTFMPVSEIVSIAESCSINVMREYGGTSLSKRLYWEFLHAGLSVRLEDAQDLPNYRAKLRSHHFKDIDKSEGGYTLILDNFNFRRHEKLIKEIQSLELFDRFIVINTIASTDNIDPPAYIGDIESFNVFLWPLGRTEIRHLAEELLDTADDVFVSSVVQKIYGDLLDLAIPLTPSNVIMYLKVLHREHDFHPFNRVEIVDKYIKDALVNPSDIFQGSFNAREKLDVLSEFCFRIFRDKKEAFSDADWNSFCDEYTRETLTEFGANELLADLHRSRIVVQFDNQWYFKYSFYFSFLVGRHIAGRPDEIADFLANDRIYALPGVLETVCALSGFGNIIIEHVVADLDTKLSQFEAEYIPQEYDPLREAEWTLGGDEDKIWERVTKQVEEGPVPVQELDLIRTSLTLEARSQRQQVRYRDMKRLEVQVFDTAAVLADALKASHGVRGELKKRAVRAFLKTQSIGMQIGIILAKEIAKKRWYQWGGLLFIGFESPDGSKEDENRAELRIISSVPGSVCVKASEDIATRKLGEVFKACALEEESGSFLSLEIFSCILESKPTKWDAAIARQIMNIDKKAFFLSWMLRLLMKDFKEGINTQHDRELLKGLVGMIHAKRGRGEATPSARLVKDVLRTLEKEGVFDTKPQV